MFTPETATKAGQQSGRVRRAPTAERLAQDAIDRLVAKVAAERPPLTDKQRNLLLALLGEDQPAASGREQ